MAIVEAVTQIELEGMAKGYGARFDDYVDIDAPILIGAGDYAQLVAWCEPYAARAHEVQGAFVFHFDHANQRVLVERVYVMGGNSRSFRCTCEIDMEDMVRQVKADYADCTALMSDRCGFWHLHHAAQYSSLSVGDVEEQREVLRDSNTLDTQILHLLMYKHPSSGYVLTGYLIGIDEVNRLPVRIAEPF